MIRARGCIAWPGVVVCLGTMMVVGLGLVGGARASAQQDTALPLEEGGDWLIDPSPYRARIDADRQRVELTLTNGLVRRKLRLRPNGATVALDNLMTGAAMLRGVKPEASVEIDGKRYEVGGLQGQPNYAYLDPAWLDRLTAAAGAFRFAGYEIVTLRPRLEWKQVRHHAPGVVWPPRGVHLRMDYLPPTETEDTPPAVRVSVHYVLYDGLPLMCKWITVHNEGSRAVRLDGFTSELLAAVEASSFVEQGGELTPRPPLYVETDYAFAGMSAQAASRWAVHWVADPDYKTQVHYRRRNPCLLEVRPELGPAQVIAPGGTFESFRAFELAFDTTERERRGLAVRRMMRTIAPWVTENPLMMHMRDAKPAAVRRAIDQCAAVGFEMLILSFGSGFNIENDDPAYITQWREIADYARSKGIEIGGYSLLASRRVGGGNDVVLPKGQRPRFGNSPCLGSAWGKAYFHKLYSFFEQTGFMLLEHDGSYPGDACIATNHPGHRGYEDSRWNQWRTITRFYKWCRARGVYLNVPDWYFLCGSNKCGMGYRETNWSLPRAQQVIHTRQNIYDGTWRKTPSMGWMFVPLTQYHGGGAAATIEPLHEHLDHYERMVTSNLAFGVQACYRGPRLYDCDETRDMLKKWVAWYKQYRDILESDLIHGRRADGRDLDWMLHVNPRLDARGMLVVFNPLPRAVRRTLTVNLYYTGLRKLASVRPEGGDAQPYKLDRAYRVRIPVEVPPRGMRWFVIE